MSYEFQTFLPTEAALLLFGRFMAAGFVLGIVYNAVRLLRLSAGLGRVFMTVTDLLFVMLFGVTVFIFSVAYGTGELRLYYIIAALLGFLICMMTVGSVIGFFALLLNRLFRRVGAFLKRRVFVPIYCKIRLICRKLKYKFVEICQKTFIHLEKPKNYLKNKLNIVYNKYNNAKMGLLSEKGGENRDAIKARVTKIL